MTEEGITKRVIDWTATSYMRDGITSQDFVEAVQYNKVIAEKALMGVTGRVLAQGLHNPDQQGPDHMGEPMPEFGGGGK